MTSGCAYFAPVTDHVESRYLQKNVCCSVLKANNRGIYACVVVSSVSATSDVEIIFMNDLQTARKLIMCKDRLFFSSALHS